MNASNHIKQTISLLLLTNISCFAASNFININSTEEFNKQVLESKKPSLVKFAADWCGVCKGVKKPFEEVAKEEEFAYVQFVHVNVDKAKELSDSYSVTGIPTFIYFDNGKKVFEESGMQDMKKAKDHLRENIRKYLPKESQTKVDAQTDSEPMQAQDANAAEQQKTEGFLDTVASIFKQIIDLIVNVIKYAIDAIRGLFNK